MKTTLLSFALALVLGSAGSLRGQTCDTFYPLIKGVSGEMTNYSAKGKEQSRATFTVLDAKTATEGTDARLKGEVYDAKGKLLTQTEYAVQCRNGNILVDMGSMLNNPVQGMKDVEVKVESAFLEYPANLKTGDNLSAGKTNMTIMAQGKEISTSSMDISNRRVTGQEDLTTPAGTFKTNVIEYDLVTHTKTLGMGKPEKMRVKEWVSPGTGVVRTETYRDNNKLEGYTVLTKLTK